MNALIIAITFLVTCLIATSHSQACKVPNTKSLKFTLLPATDMFPFWCTADTGSWQVSEALELSVLIGRAVYQGQSFTLTLIDSEDGPSFLAVQDATRKKSTMPLGIDDCALLRGDSADTLTFGSLVSSTQGDLFSGVVEWIATSNALPASTNNLCNSQVGPDLQEYSQSILSGLTLDHINFYTSL
ncbi:hypothetical protein BZG36_05048 [Bifiguratus adelaidae]|uniref:Reelin domain-containing protein n=1 Tax=Bifiguratus adelaidae TaxID=1938954 RepID=A0A261XYU5_9FUNG|nr:hypothetical protein BZG36_05048 [Bifiguratus adelaidae]